MQKNVLLSAAVLAISSPFVLPSFGATITADSVAVLDPNPSNLFITEVGNTSLTASRALIAAAHPLNRGGAIDFQQQFQGGTFPNSLSNNNGVDFANGPANPLLITTTSAAGAGGLVATGMPIFSMYRLESDGAATNNVDSNLNQGGNIISGGYKSRNAGPVIPGANQALPGNGDAVVGTIDFATTPGTPIPDGTAVPVTNNGGGYIGITGSGSPATLVFNTPLSFLGLTALPRGATRDTLMTVTLTDGTTVQVGGGAQVVGASAVFFGYAAPLGQSITRVTLTNPNGQGVNRYDDLAFVLAVPEPTTLAAAAGGAVTLLRRRPSVR